MEYTHVCKCMHTKRRHVLGYFFCILKKLFCAVDHFPLQVNHIYIKPYYLLSLQTRANAYI